MAATQKKIKHSKLDNVQINPGLTVLHPNPDELKQTGKFSLDIVAVPGLGANPEWTWVREKVHWLRDGNMLARKVPNARISVFQYESQWFGKGAVDQRLENVANQLLYRIMHSRPKTCTAPIIFVCHCLGGIIVERALITAKLRQIDFPNVFPWVAGCIFLGTPFHGTKSQEKARVLAELAETASLGMNSGLLKLLEKDSEVLGQMLDEFVHLANEAQMQLFCFFESKKSDIAALLFKSLPFTKEEMIVDQDSATFPGCRRLQLSSDHFGLNKFTGPKDGNYISVSDEIKAIAQKAPGIIKSRRNALRQALVEDSTYNAILDALGNGFSDLDKAIKGSVGGSTVNQPSWVIEADSYKIWKREQETQVLWINGKAGTGQLPIALSVINDLDRTRETPSGTVVASFFCDQGDEMRRSLIGLLKLLVRQVINANRDMAVHLLSDSKKEKRGNISSQAFDVSSVSTLWSSLQAMMKDPNFGPASFVIYGLEQLSKDSMKELFRYMKDSSAASLTEGSESEGAIIKWVLLSRSGRPDIEKLLKGKSLEISMDDTENAGYVSDALRAEVSARVDELGYSKSLAYFVKRHIHSRAEGNYIYVSLVIQELKNLDSSSMTHAELRTLLEGFPYGLTDMFEHIRKRVLDPAREGIEYTREILRCLVLAQRSPTLPELAVMAGLPLVDRNNLAVLRQYLIRCGAFVTLRGNPYDEDSNTVEWVDLSALEHLEKYAKDELCLDLRDMQHGIIGLRCFEYICEAYKPASLETDSDDEQDAESEEEHVEDRADTKAADLGDDSHSTQCTHEEPIDSNEAGETQEGVSSLADELPDAREDLQSPTFEDSPPVLTYPVEYWLEHAKLAPEDVIDEFDFSQSFWQEESTIREAWWSANSSAHPLADQKGVTPLHIAVITDYLSLVETLLKRKEGDVHREDLLGFQPLYYAAMNGNIEIVQSLLGAGADVNAISAEGKVSALWCAASSGHSDVVECLIERGAEVNTVDEDFGTPLYAAVECGHSEVVRTLLANGAKVNLAGGWHCRAINAAAYCGDLEAIQTLLEKDAEVDPEEDYEYGSALGAAARRGHADIVRLLLERGWSVNKQIKVYGSFIAAAATYGHVDVVQALLEKEPTLTSMENALRVSSKNGKAPVVKAILDHAPTLRHQKAFMLAASYGRDDVLVLLKERGADSEMLNTALYEAADYEHEDTVKLLLDFGADPNAEGEEYGTALTAAAFDGTEGIIKALLGKGADVNKRGGNYGTALQAAALNGDADIVRILLDHGAEVHTEQIGIYGSAFQAACYNGNEDLIALLLEHGADVNVSGGQYGYPIIAAACEGDADTVKTLVSHGADVNVRGGEDNAPLIVHGGAHLLREILELLLDHGADVNSVDEHGTTALMNAADTGDADGIEFLLSRGANLHVSGDKFGTALHAAAAQGDEECCGILIKSGANVNQQCGPWGTALQAAALASDLETIQVLLKAGADVNLDGGEYGSPLQATAYDGNLESLAELLNAGADVNQLGGKYGFPLQAAAVVGNYDCMETLLERGAYANQEGGMYGSALLAALSKYQNDHCIELLLDHNASVTVQAGLLGSAIQAAAFGNNFGFFDALVERGADVHGLGGKYGHALQVASFKADIAFVDALCLKGVDVNRCCGKYATALQAAAYADRLDIVEKLLEHGADVSIKGGRYGSAISAAVVKGNKMVLGKLLEFPLPENMLDEALIQAAYHRQTEIVEMLLKCGANVHARDLVLGSAIDVLQMEQPNDSNSDDEAEEDEDDDDSDSEEDEEEEEEEGEGDEEGEDAQQDPNVEEDDQSIMSLELDEDVTDQSKIQNLLEEAMARVKRNPSVKRFRTVKRRPVPQYQHSDVLTAPRKEAGLPASLNVGPQSQQSNSALYPYPSTQSNRQTWSPEKFTSQQPYSKPSPPTSEYAAYSAKQPYKAYLPYSGSAASSSPAVPSQYSTSNPSYQAYTPARYGIPSSTPTQPAAPGYSHRPALSQYSLSQPALSSDYPAPLSVYKPRREPSGQSQSSISENNRPENSSSKLPSRPSKTWN